ATKMETQSAAEGPDDPLEAIARDIETLQRSALMQISKKLAEAREIFRYRRDDGGFGGWVESRLNYSRQTAYNLLHLLERFGEESVQLFDTLAPTVLYALAAPSTPQEVRRQVIEHVESGEKVTVKQVKQQIADAKQPTEQLLDGPTLAKARWGAVTKEELQKEEREARH